MLCSLILSITPAHRSHVNSLLIFIAVYIPLFVRLLPETTETNRNEYTKGERTVQPGTPAVGHPFSLLGGARLAAEQVRAARGSVAHLR